VPAQSESRVDLDSLLGETMIQARAGDRLTMVWWVPEEFWRSAFATDRLVDPEGTEEFLAAIRPYVIFGTLDGTFGPAGPSDFLDGSTLRKLVVLRDESGTEYAPLGREQISPDAQILGAVMKPAAEDLLGPVGEHMEFLYFPAQTEEGVLIADAGSRGVFSLAVGNATFEWVLPLDSVLPRKRCLIDEREMRGEWIYCPFHGIRLVED
jgi:hypothetical protein